MLNTILLGATLALVGCEGPAGEAGPAGPDGADGANGADGSNGADGAPGANGVDGAPGADGADGADAELDPLLAPLDKAFAGIGGLAALEALDGFELVTSGESGIGYEGYTPADFFPVAAAYETTVSGDLLGDAWRLDVEREAYFFGFPLAQSFSEVLAAELGEIDGSESILGQPSAMPSDRWASIRRNQRFLNPHLILADLAADPALVTDGGVQLLDGSVHHLLIVEDTVSPITLYVNAATGQIAKLSTWENDPTFSDVPVEVFYYGWAPSDGDLLFPTEVYVAVDGQIVRSETRTAVAVNPAFAAGLFDFVGVPIAHDAALAERGERNGQFHQVFAGIGIPVDGLQAAISPTELAPGVWHLTGGSHHSMVIEQADGLVLFDAPLRPEQAELLLDWASQQFPSKPITHVVASHFHRDHVGGLRSLVAVGATVVVHEAVEDFYRDLFTRERTLEPDALSASPVPATFALVPHLGTLTLPDPTHPVDVLSIVSSHSQDLVVPYLPNEQLGFAVDIYSPGTGSANFFGLELHTALVERGLAGTTLAGGHGFGTSSWETLETELQAAGLL